MMPLSRFTVLDLTRVRSPDPGGVQQRPQPARGPQESARAGVGRPAASV